MRRAIYEPSPEFDIKAFEVTGHHLGSGKNVASISALDLRIYESADELRAFADDEIAAEHERLNREERIAGVGSGRPAAVGARGAATSGCAAAPA